MRIRLLDRAALITLLLAATAVQAQSGLRVPQRGEPGLDPAYARGWLAPDFDRFGFARQWREHFRLGGGRGPDWGLRIGGRNGLSLSLEGGKELDYSAEERRLSLFGRYSFGEDWAVSAETMSRDASGLLRLQDFRIGVQRQF